MDSSNRQDTRLQCYADDGGVGLWSPDGTLFSVSRDDTDDEFTILARDPYGGLKVAWYNNVMDLPSANQFLTVFNKELNREDDPLWMMEKDFDRFTTFVYWWFKLKSEFDRKIKKLAEGLGIDL